MWYRIPYRENPDLISISDKRHFNNRNHLSHRTIELRYKTLDTQLKGLQKEMFRQRGYFVNQCTQGRAMGAKQAQPHLSRTAESHQSSLIEHLVYLSNDAPGANGILKLFH